MAALEITVHLQARPELAQRLKIDLMRVCRIVENVAQNMLRRAVRVKTTVNEFPAAGELPGPDLGIIVEAPCDHLVTAEELHYECVRVIGLDSTKLAVEIRTPLNSLVFG